MNHLFNTMSLMKSGGNSETYRSPTLGLDLLYGGYVSQQLQYRQQQVFQLIEFAKNTEEIRAPINHILNEVFRRGIEWKPKFAVRCTLCATEYTEKVKECEECADTLPERKKIAMAEGKTPQEGKLVKPRKSQRKIFDKFRNDSNVFDMSFESVLRALWFDINSLDDMFLHIVKEYSDINGPNEPIHSKPIEIRRLNPAYMEWDLSPEGLPKCSHWVCYIHRDIEPSESPGKCVECDRSLVAAMYKYSYRAHPLYLLDSEIIHASKFYHSETYGYSPLLTLMHKILTIRGMDLNVYRYFFERRMPASMLMVFTDDPESLRRERDNIAAKMRYDPNYIPMVAVGTKNGRGRVDMVRLFHTLQEMDYLPVREEIRERIAAMWGVTPAWQGSPDAYGGMSSQTQQLTVMSRVVEGDQRILHEKVFPPLLEAFGITDWELELKQPEEKAEATRIAFAQQRVSVANMLLQMGFGVEIKAGKMGIDNIEFEISGEALNPIEQQEAMMEATMPDGGGGGFGAPGKAAATMPGDDSSGMGEEKSAGEEQAGDVSQEPNLTLSKMDVPGFIPLHKQLADRGYKFPAMHEVTENHVIFNVADSPLYKATLHNGTILEIEKFVPARMHKHSGRPLHDTNIKHNAGVDRKPRSESNLFDPEIPEEPDVI
jgi:hypothetical protein